MAESSDTRRRRRLRDEGEPPRSLRSGFWRELRNRQILRSIIAVGLCTYRAFRFVQRVFEFFE